MMVQKTNNIIDENLVIEFAENLIKEMKNYDDTTIGYIMEEKQAIHAASITSKRLSQVTGSKFYYAVRRYLMDL